MRTTWEKIVHHVGTIHGEDISNELLNRQTLNLDEPKYSQDVLDRQAKAESHRKMQHENLQKARAETVVMLEDIVKDGKDPEAKIKLATLVNLINEDDFKFEVPLPIVLVGEDKARWETKWRIYKDKVSSLAKHRGMAYSMVRGQCMQVLLDKMKHDSDWIKTSVSSNPLLLMSMIEKTILAQTEDQYPHATVYDQELSLLQFHQNQLSNEQWYERFNTKVDVGGAIGITRQHKVLLEHAAQDVHKMEFAALPDADKITVREDAEERYLSYIFLRQSGKQHNTLRLDLSNDYTKGNDQHPKTRQATLHFLDKYSKTAVSAPTIQEGSSFAQKGGTRGRFDENDKKFWKDKTCYNCKEKGHPAPLCPKKGSKTKAKEDDDDKSKSSKSSKSSKTSLAKLQKDMKKTKKSFTTLQTQIEELENDSDLTDSDEEESSHFQFDSNSAWIERVHENTGVQSTQQVFYNNKSTKKRKDTRKSTTRLNLRDVILLDNESTMDLFCNKDLVTEIAKTTGKMTVEGNGGKMQVRHKATVPGYARRVWFDKKAITNIISLSNLRAQYRITYDSDASSSFTVHREAVNLPNMEFKMHPSGLHYYDPAEFSEAKIFVNTVSGKMEGYSKRQIKGAEQASALYAKLGYPSHKDFKWILRSNQIKDCPVTVDDADNALNIWGKNVAALKGKTTRRKPMPVKGNQLRVPREFMKLHKYVHLTADIFFVNKIPFFITLSRNIDFTAVTHLKDRKAKTIFEAFKSHYRYYLQRGFIITTAHADGEFGALQVYINNMTGGPRMNLASANEHVPEIERRIRVLKERNRATTHAQPFTTVPKIMTIHNVLGSAKMLTNFPGKAGISETLSPRAILTGESLDYKKHLALQPGEYCQVHEEDTPRNSQNPRTRGAICMGPSGNQQGGFKFMALNTGSKLVRRSWDRLPMPDTVIARVNYLGRDQPKQMTFTDRKGQLIGEIELPGVARGEDEPPHNQIQNDVIEEEDDLDQLAIMDNNPPAEQLAPVAEEVELALDDLEVPENEILVDPEVPVQEEVQENVPVQAAAAPAAVPQPAQVEPEATAGVRKSTRARSKPKSYVPSMTGSKYAFAVTQLENHGAMHPDLHMSFCQNMIEEQPDAVAAIMTQLSLKAGMKEWGGKARKAAYSEMKQLHLRTTFRPMHWKELSKQQKECVLESHMFLKEKRDGTIKGRTVAGGNKQRDFISKEEASSPTVATEAVLLTCVVDAKEERDVKVIDIPNAFIQTKIENEEDMAIIKIRGILVEMLLAIAPEVYGPYVTTDKKGVKQIIMQCLNAIYGTMIASLLYYLKFCRTLKANGFTMNPYDPCVANRMVDGKQQTICFHVDDCKISHVDEKVNDKFIDVLRGEYESIFEDGSGKMKVSQGKILEYLGMTLDYSVKGQVKITMLDYVKECLNTFDKIAPKEGGTKTSAAPSNLFVVKEDSERLSKEKAEQFHSLVAKILFATKRARPDTGTSISYLTTRVREPNQDDWLKLVHLMKYLRGTKDLPLILRADGTGMLKWFVDASHGVHANMRGHTGGGLTMGTGYPITASKKQKFNTKSSTETEIVGADDLMPAVLWTRLFLEAQDYEVTENIMYQDNKSAILLEKNGKASSGKRTKHINMRYFFITDRISKKDMSVEWCPTGDMTGDFFTKPVQGALFRRFRDLIMGVVAQPNPGPGKSKKERPNKEKLGKRKVKPG